MAVTKSDLPLASRDYKWDASAADKRVRTWADAENAPNAKYAQAFFWHDTADEAGEKNDSPSEEFGDYKLPFADVVDGKLYAIPRAIFAVAGRLDQTDIPAADKAAVKTQVEHYYAKMASAFDDDSIKAPWQKAEPTQIERFLNEGKHEFTVEVRAANVDDKARTVEMAFSSEAPVDRFFGREILDHSPNAVRLNRLNGGAPLLLNHDTDQQIGVVERAFIGDDRRGRAVVRFSRSALGQEIFNDVQDGIRRLVSVGYRVHGEPTDEGDRTYRFSDWEPLELSIVPIPADETVGIGRSADFQTSRKEATKMADEKPAVGTENIDVKAVETEARRNESDRVRNIYGLARKWGDRLEKLDEKAQEFVDQGRSLDAFREHVMERLEEAGEVRAAKPSDLDVGLNDQERKDFSIVRLINYEIAVRKGEKVPEAGRFEREVVDAAAKKAAQHGREVKGVLIPHEVLTPRMGDLSNMSRDELISLVREVQVSGTGSNLVATNLLASNFIELLRNATPVMGLGVTHLPGLVGDIAIPRQTGGATTYWVGESVAVTESDQAFDQITLSPKTLGANTKYSRKTLLQTTPAIEGLIRSDLARVMGVELDRVAINGSGASGQPTGILNTSGIGSVVMAADSANGGAPAWGDLVKFRTTLSKANALRGNLGWLMNGSVEGTLLGTEKAAGYPVYLLNEAGQALLGSRYALTENVPSNLTKGTGANLSALIFGNFSDLLIGEWGGFDMVIDPYSYSTQGGVQITVFRDVDLNVRHPVSFAAAKDIITS